MNCERWEESLMDLARNRPQDAGAMAHAAGCEHCAALLARERALTEDLRSLARIARPAEARPHVEQAVMNGFHAHRRRRREITVARWLTSAAMVALLISAALWMLRAGPKQQPAVAASAPPVMEDYRGFLPVPYRSSPFERGYVVRVQMPRSALVSLGMPVPAGEREVVQADLLLAEDGLAQAVRLVH